MECVGGDITRERERERENKPLRGDWSGKARLASKGEVEGGA